MYLTISGIIQESCTKCGRCVIDCPQGLFFKKDGQVLFLDAEHDNAAQCLQCGHCISICPENAVAYASAEPVFELPQAGRPERIIGAKTLEAFLRSRRSVRQFKDQQVPEKDIAAVLEAMRHAPTAGNRERIHYTVITSSAGLCVVRDAVIRMFRLVRKLLAILRFFIPFGRKKRGILGNGIFRSLTRALTRYKNNEDPVMYKAPCLIVLSSPSYGNQGGVDAGIALTHGMLAAQSMGMGTCLIGFAHEALARSSSLRKKINIPAGLKVQGAVAIGYPTVSYPRAPMRKPLSANRL